MPRATVSVDALSNAVMQVIADQTGFPLSGLRPETTLDGELEFDDLDFVETAMALEAEFSITLPDESIDENLLKTVGDFIALVGRVKA